MHMYILFLLFSGSDLVGFEGQQFALFQAEEKLPKDVPCAQIIHDADFLREARREVPRGLTMRVQCVRSRSNAAWGEVVAENTIP